MSQPFKFRRVSAGFTRTEPRGYEIRRDGRYWDVFSTKPYEVVLASFRHLAEAKAWLVRNYETKPLKVDTAPSDGLAFASTVAIEGN